MVKLKGFINMKTLPKAYTDYTEEQIEESQGKEKEAFHALMKLIAPANQDEAIAFYVQATQATFWEGYYKGRTVSQN